jgi:hypothetical protein
MKARHAYPLLFLLPSAMLAMLAAVAVAVGGAGLLWLFVYGDAGRPAAADTTLMALAGGAALLVLAMLLRACHGFGKAREPLGGVARRHVVLAVAASVGLPALVLLHQWQVGNLG